MKVGFFGYCQLNTAAQVLQNSVRNGLLDADIAYIDDAYLMTNERCLGLLHALDKLDVVFCQHYRDPHGRKIMWSTDSLKKYFNVKVVPMLTSPLPNVHFHYWSIWERRTGNVNVCNGDLQGIDFRILELYLAGLPFYDVSACYHDVVIGARTVHQTILATARKHRLRYEQGLVAYDYSGFYARKMSEDVASYSLFNHPMNVHMDWLISAISRDLGGGDLHYTGPDLLLASMPPNLLGAKSQSYIWNRHEENIDFAARIYYCLFDTFERAWLEREFYGSSYYKNFRAERCSTVTGEFTNVVAHADPGMDLIAELR